MMTKLVFVGSVLIALSGCVSMDKTESLERASLDQPANPSDKDAKKKESRRSDFMERRGGVFERM